MFNEKHLYLTEIQWNILVFFIEIRFILCFFSGVPHFYEEKSEFGHIFIVFGYTFQVPGHIFQVFGHTFKFLGTLYKFVDTFFNTL